MTLVTFDALFSGNPFLVPGDTLFGIENKSRRLAAHGNSEICRVSTSKCQTADQANLTHSRSSILLCTHLQDHPASRYARRMSHATLVWSSKAHAGLLVLSPEGKIDEHTADELRDRVAEAGASDMATLVLDLSRIAFMTSRGLRALTLAQRECDEAGTALILVCPGAAMREILAISRYDMVFRIADTLEDALGI